jgi:hypothetical protein
VNATATTTLGGGATNPFGNEKTEQFASQVQGPGAIPRACFGPVF